MQPGVVRGYRMRSLQRVSPQAEVKQQDTVSFVWILDALLFCQGLIIRSGFAWHQELRACLAIPRRVPSSLRRGKPVRLPLR